MKNKKIEKLKVSRWTDIETVQDKINELIQSYNDSLEGGEEYDWEKELDVLTDNPAFMVCINRDCECHKDTPDLISKKKVSETIKGMFSKKFWKQIKTDGRKKGFKQYIYEQALVDVKRILEALK